MVRRRPYYYEDRHRWVQHAFDPREKAKADLRSREWTAVTASEVEVVRELARWLWLIGEGRVPE